MTEFLYPDWPAPEQVKAFSTTRIGGVSTGPFSDNNLALHVQDEEALVLLNREKLNRYLPVEPSWLNQTHGIEVVCCADEKTDADASYNNRADYVCVVMTADCLPILLCDTSGQQVAAVHAGWRGLLDGVIENSIAMFQGSKHNILAWLGPAIGKTAFEVGEEVYGMFTQKHPEANRYFQACGNRKYLMDIYGLASFRLKLVGVTKIFGGECCTYSDETRFFSYRRDGVCGRMASLIWLDKP